MFFDYSPCIFIHLKVKGDEFLEEDKENMDSDKKKVPEEIPLQGFDQKMIRSFMRGFGKTMVLWMISKNRLHGYEIMNKLHHYYSLEEAHANLKPPGPSVIYPILHDLEKKGLIKGIWEAQGKRKVKYYEITPDGEATIQRIKNVIESKIAPLWEDFWGEMFAPDKDK
ncbi:PadR family transcriptional regulator [Methanobacterium alkalithermotolerans]|nr:PadR family transcriptional regulator [Methanobacterium alkalithermotolerans]